MSIKKIPLGFTRNKKFRILAIESSCDETSASVILYNYFPFLRDRVKKESKTSSNLQMLQIEVLSNIVSSQIKLHAKYGGVYPELASREHVRNILPVIEEAITGISNSQFPISNPSSRNLQFHYRTSKMSKSKCQTPVVEQKFTTGQVPNEVQIPNDQNLKSEILNLKSEIDYIAVTIGPGLIGSLLVGVETAKTLAYVLGKPIVPVNHLEGHIYANFIGENPKYKTLNSKQIPNSKSKFSKQNNNITIWQYNNLPKFPLICLVVSGGHTSLVYMKDHLDYKIIGETLDDAVGEAFDKVAAMLGLGYPGGPAVEACASKISKKCHPEFISGSQFSEIPKQVRNDIKSYKLFHFPRPMINAKNFDFSFSGIKTAVLYAIKKLPKPLSAQTKQIICKEFQDAVVETLVAKTLRAAEKYKVKSILLGGGVAANSYLRKEFGIALGCHPELVSGSQSCEIPKRVRNDNIKLFIPPKSLCTDNAAVIGVAAAYKILLKYNTYPFVALAKRDKILAGKITSWDKITANANLKL